MKTSEYFTAKTTELKKELKETIKELLYSEDSGMISHINIDDNIVIYPEGSDLDPIDLDCIESIHDLMLLHFILFLIIFSISLIVFSILFI